MHGKIALLKGDGIGPEIIDSAVLVLQRTGEKFGHKFAFSAYPIGGGAYDQFKTPLPDATINGCLANDAVLLGAVGGPQWDNLPGDLRPEKGLLGIRAALKLYANLRPAKLFPALGDACPLRAEIVPRGFDLIIVRELTGGIYFGERGRSADRKTAFDTEKYSEEEILRIGRVAFATAMKRRKKLTSIDKANVLETSRLWRETIHKLAKEYPEVEVADLLVDNAAMQLVRNPAQFDVIVASNLFGDILSDEIAQITGSIGMLASASLGDTARGLYEPIHGSAPDITGKGVANPIATILSAAMLLRHSFALNEEAAAIENAVNNVLDSGKRTADICGNSTIAPIGTSAMTAAIIAAI